MENNDKINFFLKQVGFNMCQVRKNRKMTQSDVAKALGMAKISYGVIERGQIATSLKTFFKIAEFLNVSPAKLVCEKDEILLSKTDIIQFYTQGAK